MRTEADILARMYWDKATVYRPFKSSLSNGETAFKRGKDGQVIYKDIICALSTQSGGQVQQSNSAASTPLEMVLFVRPEIEILPNDYIAVTRRDKTDYFIAGVPDRLPSHNNIPLKNAREFV